MDTPALVADERRVEGLETKAKQLENDFYAQSDISAATA